MAIDDKTPSGDDNKDDNTPVENPPNPEGKDGDKVAYESYKKLLTEKKTIQLKLDKLQKETDERVKTELESQQKYKELYEAGKSESEDLKKKLQAHDERWQDALKLNAFNSALGDTRKIESKFYGFIDTTKILIDPETNKADPVSVQKEVDRVTKEYPEIIKSTVKGDLPNQSPTGGKGLTYAEWKNLPVKEMKARRKEVID